LVVLLVVILFFLIFAPQAQIFVDRVFYRKRYKHLQALYRYTGQTRTLDEINAMPSSLASLISSALDAGRIFLFVYSPIQEVFAEAASSPRNEGPPLEIPDGSPLILQLKQREGAFPIQDAEGATTDLAPYPETLEIVKRVGASVLLPLTIQEELVGVLTLGNKKTGKGYSQEDIELMNEIAPRLSLSLKNYQLYTMETRRLEEVIALRRGVGLIMKELDVKAIMDRAVGEGARLLGVPAAAFAVLGGKDGKPEDNYFRIETSFGLSPEFVRQTRIPLNSALRRYGVPPGSMELKIEASGDITIQPSDPGRTYPDSAVIEDIPSNPVGNPDLEAEENLSSALILPIITSRGFLGTLVFFQKSPVRRFTKYLRELARSFADSVAVALEKARLYELEKEERLALKKIEDQRQLFLSAITHELRTPITSMKLSTDLLAEELEASELSTTRRLLANIHRSVDSLNSRIDDLVRFVRLNAPDLTINKETVSLQLVVKSALDLCQPFFTQKKQVIVTELPASLPPVMADRFRLEQILSNLLLNAGKFTPEGSTITLRAAVPGNSAYRGSVLVEIEDCGVPGIAAEDIENIFEPFSRGRGKTVTGLGLGLAIARRLVNVHGGRIWAESQPGVKTVFYFTLPLATTGK
ncbi:MAG: GAF domain-containing sensor histidine kinase, partial [Dehalococcoidia bacterium]|nr:GAF domain-containing sensor histidine kinase [Dehalococcoidia bacterium]